MSIPQAADGNVESKADLVAYLEQGCKPEADWRIGTEHEKFGFRLSNHSPIPFDGPGGIEDILKELGHRFGWEPVLEAGRVLGLKCASGEGSISLEPGGQLELSGAAVETIHQTCKEVNGHLEQVREVGKALGVGFLGLGFSPKWTLAETPRMPKGRYAIMANYMPKVGSRGLDMMFRTCTVQVNLDFASEADMVKKMRASLALQPIATALFANSPFTEGKPNGFLSYRSEVWRDTDNDRAGMLPFAFEDGMGFERYVDYALDVPMYFLLRDGRYIDVAGKSFRDFLDGDLKELPGEKPTMGDWANHLTTIFPEVRIKRFMEMRGADGVPWKGLCGLPALWVGLLYDSRALDAAWQLVKDWTAAERQALRDAVPRFGLKAEIHGRTAGEVARDMVALAREGLVSRARRNGYGADETEFLEVVEEVADSGITPAERLLAQFHNEWNGDIDGIFQVSAY